MEMQPIDKHLKILIFNLFHELGKTGKSRLDQHSNIPIFNHWSYSLRPTFKNPTFGSLDGLRKRENLHKIGPVTF